MCSAPPVLVRPLCESQRVSRKRKARTAHSDTENVAVKRVGSISTVIGSHWWSRRSAREEPSAVDQTPPPRPDHLWRAVNRWHHDNRAGGLQFTSSKLYPRPHQGITLAFVPRKRPIAKRRQRHQTILTTPLREPQPAEREHSTLVQQRPNRVRVLGSRKQHRKEATGKPPGGIIADEDQKGPFDRIGLLAWAAIDQKPTSMLDILAESAPCALGKAHDRLETEQRRVIGTLGLRRAESEEAISALYWMAAAAAPL